MSNPEFTAEGTAVRDFLHPDRVVVGSFRDEDGDLVAALHAGIDGPIVRCDVASAEMIKLAANAALMTRISFINEIANVCEATGADVVRVAEGIGLDRRIGPSFLRAGIGFGGSCFPKDSLALKQLAANSGYHFQLLNAVIEVNELQKRRVIGKLHSHLGTLRGKTVALLGLAFKPDTDDMREAPSLVLAGRLLAEGAHVRAWDPVVDGQLPARRRDRDRSRGCGDGADAVVIVTEWPQLAGVDWAAVGATMQTRILIDGRNMLDPEALRAAGFAYEGIGRAGRRPARGSDGRDHPRRRQGRASRRRRGRQAEGARPDRRASARRLPGEPASAGRCAPGDRELRAGAGRPVRGGAAGLGCDVVPVEEPEPLGRGGGLRFAAAAREHDGPLFALNGDELLDVDLEAMLERHRAQGAAATIAVAPIVVPARRRRRRGRRFRLRLSRGRRRCPTG